jgi:CheY-like chemotaxis protein
MIPNSEFQNPRSVDFLLVEDNPDHVELILKVLQDNNVLNPVHVVTNGEKALDFLYQREEYADAPRLGLILLDIKLPRIDGTEVLRRIKADPKFESIPVVMLTSSVSEQEMVESYSFGADSYIIKPVAFEQFAKVIKDLNLYWQVINVLPT